MIVYHLKRFTAPYWAELDPELGLNGGFGHYVIFGSSDSVGPTIFHKFHFNLDFFSSFRSFTVHFPFKRFTSVIMSSFCVFLVHFEVFTINLHLTSFLFFSAHFGFYTFCSNLGSRGFPRANL